ncbi:MAG: signal peptidase II [bacterium]
MKDFRKLFIIALVVGNCIGCDQVSKNIATNTLKFTEPITYFGNLFRLQYAENTGAFLSLGSDLSEISRTWLFTILSGGLLFLLLFYMLKNSHFSQKQVFALSLILGGGSSNLIDRILNDGRVIDFMNMGIGELRTGIFNIADVVIMLGMALILLFSFRERSKQDSSEAENTQ